MVLGLDYNGVLTHNPNAFRKLARQFDKVVIISATQKPVDLSIRRLMIQDKNFKPAEITTLDFSHINEIPFIKLQACKDHGVNIYIDDMEAVCALLNRNNILALIYKGA